MGGGYTLDGLGCLLGWGYWKFSNFFTRRRPPRAFTPKVATHINQFSYLPLLPSSSPISLPLIPTRINQHTYPSIIYLISSCLPSMYRHFDKMWGWGYEKYSNIVLIRLGSVFEKNSGNKMAKSLFIEQDTKVDM